MMEILGTSRSGIRTCFIVPEMRVVLDMGYCPDEAVKFQDVFVTHGHPDHSAGLVQHAATRALLAPGLPSRFYVPAPIVDDLRALIAAAERMQNDSIPCDIQPVHAGDQIPVAKGLMAVAFPTDHTVPSLGYVFKRTRQKLKDEFRGRLNAEIAGLRQNGVEVTRPVTFIELAYPGDTRATVLDTVPELTKARVLLMESTFIGDDFSDEFAAERGHTHLRQHADRAHHYQNERVILTHLSMRHSADEFAEALRQLPEPLQSKAEILI